MSDTIPEDGGWKGTGQGADNQGMARLVNQMRSLQAQLNELKGAAPLRAAGVHAAPDGLTVDSSLTVGGDLTANGDTVIGGNATITGTLSLPAGIINNEALANPVTYRSALGGEDGFAITTSPVERGFADIIVPAQFTETVYTVLGSCNVLNNSAATQYAYLESFMEVVETGAWAKGGTQRITLSAGFQGSMLAPLIRGRVGLVGGQTLRFYVRIWASADFAAEANAWVSTDVMAQFAR